MELDAKTRERITSCLVLSALTILITASIMWALFSGKKNDPPPAPPDIVTSDVFSLNVTNGYFEAHHHIVERLYHLIDQVKFVLIEPCILSSFLSKTQQDLLKHLSPSLQTRIDCSTAQRDQDILTFYASEITQGAWRRIKNTIESFMKSLVVVTKGNLIHHVYGGVKYNKENKENGEKKIEFDLVVHIVCDVSRNERVTIFSKSTETFKSVRGFRFGDQKAIFEKISPINALINGASVFIPQRTFRFLMELPHSNHTPKSDCDTNEIDDAKDSTSFLATQSKFTFIKDFLYRNGIAYIIDDFSFHHWFHHCIDFPLMSGIATMLKEESRRKHIFGKLKSSAQLNNWTVYIENRYYSVHMRHDEYHMLTWNVMSYYAPKGANARARMVKELGKYGRYEFETKPKYFEEICSSVMFGSIKVNVPCDYHDAYYYATEMEFETISERMFMGDYNESDWRR